MSREECLEDEVIYLFGTSVIEGGFNYINWCFLKLQ